MDTLRGHIGSFDDDLRDDDYGEDDITREAPPSPVGQDERRMQVRAYNHWAGLLQDRSFPSIEDLAPDQLPDFGPYSVLLDFSAGIENPGVQYLGDQLAAECGTEGVIRTLDDVPSRSLLSRITDHYMQILANQAPIGFEAEFVNQRGATILYRGILLPFSSDDDTIDFIYGVINWKEVADQLTADELLLEIDQALEQDAPDLGPIDIETAMLAPDAPAGWPDASEELPDDVAAIAAAAADGEEWHEDEGAYSEFVLPDIGDADEEDFIDQDAYASLSPDVENVDSLVGLGGLRSKPAKRPLDLTIAQTLTPLDGSEPEDEFDEDYPAPAFGAADDRFASLLGSGYDDADEEDEDEDEDDGTEDGTVDAGWSAPFDLDQAFELAEETPEDFPAVGFGATDLAPAEEALPEEALSEHAPADGEDAYGFDIAPLELDDSVEEEPAFEPLAEIADDEPFSHREILLPAAAQDDSEMGLYDTLAEARELALLASSTEDRSRAALYQAVSRAYDVSLAAQEAPEDFAELIAESGLTVQDRAPMTPVVKLVFGADYDKTRLTEYATVLGHAHRCGIERGGLKDYLATAEGGLKGVVQAERRLRRGEDAKPGESLDQLREALARKLRELEAMTLEALAGDGPEFSVVLVRRSGDGDVVVLGEVADDVALTEKVARKLVA